MSNVMEFKRPSPVKKHKGRGLCRSGFHKWEVIKDSQFDVKKGELVTLYRCSRCNKQQVGVAGSPPKKG